MALILTSNYKFYGEPFFFKIPNSKVNSSQLSGQFQRRHFSFICKERRFWVVSGSEEDPGQTGTQDDEKVSVGVKAALSLLRFYKREISPLLPKSCRYVPTCSEYSMIAYRKYGFVKGTLLTTWRVCRCNPLGGSGFDPPRWFDETTPPEQ